MNNWPPWVMPAIITILCLLVPAVFKLSNRLALAEERIDRGRVATEDERKRNDAQDVRQGASDILLAKIDAKLDLLLQKLQQVHIP